MNISDFRESRPWRAARTGAVLLCLVTFAWPHHAGAVAIYTDRGVWTAAVAAAITTDTFSNPIAFGQTVTFDSGVVSMGSGENNLSDVLTDSNTVFADGSVVPPVTLTSGMYGGRVDTFRLFQNTFARITWVFPGLIFALGADWRGATTGGELTLTGDFDGTGDVTLAVPPGAGGTGSGFFGIIGAGAFSTVALGTRLTRDEFFFVDDLSFNQSALPEPAPYGLLMLGLIGISLLRGRTLRKRNAGQAARFSADYLRLTTRLFGVQPPSRATWRKCTRRACAWCSTPTAIGRGRPRTDRVRDRTREVLETVGPGPH